MSPAPTPPRLCVGEEEEEEERSDERSEDMRKCTTALHSALLHSPLFAAA